MADLPQIARDFPLIYLALPGCNLHYQFAVLTLFCFLLFAGSHDSMSFAISPKSQLAPDAEPLLQNLRFLGPLLRFIMSKWSKTQTYDAIGQLKAGIRYFDLRLATKKGSDSIYFVHGLYSCPVEEVLRSMNDFLNEHPKEVIILDCQHFYAFGPSDHERLMSNLTTIFGAKLVPYTRDLRHLSLNFLLNFQRQIFAVYRLGTFKYAPSMTSSALPSMQPNFL